MGGRGASSGIKKAPITKMSVTVEVNDGLKKYPVKLPDSKQQVQIVRPQVITGKVFAGKSTGVEIRDRFRLETDYGVAASEWQKVSGNGKIILNGKIQKAELHWYQAKNRMYEIKVKRYLDES